MKPLRTILLFAAYVAVALTMRAQLAVGEWTAHQSFTSASKVTIVGNKIYCVADGNLFSFDKDDNSISTYDKTNYLNDTKLSIIKYAPLHRTLVIVYQNGNIDLLVDGTKTYNIPEFASSSSVKDKNIYDIYINGDYAYLSGGSGVCMINVKKREIANMYLFDSPVYATAIQGDYIYAATSEGIYQGDRRQNLLAKDNWHLFADGMFYSLFFADGKLYADYNDGVHVRNDATGQFEIFIPTQFPFKHVGDGYIIYGNGNRVVILKADGSVEEISHDQPFADLEYDASAQTLWGACGESGLNSYRIENGGLVTTNSEIRPNGPRRELFYNMRFFNGILYVGGGIRNYTNTFNPGTVMSYADGIWDYFEEDLQSRTGVPYFNVTAVAVDPRDKNHVFAGSADGGLYEFRDKKFVTLYTSAQGNEPANSSLLSAIPTDPLARRYVRVDGVTFDNKNNLWMVNSEVKTILNVLKSDGTWKAFDIADIAGLPTCDKVIVDQGGRVWFTSQRKTMGVYCLDFNGTIDDTSDDEGVFINSYVNQDGDVLGSLATYDIAEDRDGAIWIGTTEGPLVISNPARALSASSVTITQIKVPRNDGTNLADFLLKDERINAIVVDGANRKWIGTEGSGLYLLSADGIQTISHFDTSNSPLFSNRVQSLALDPATGILYVATDKGLMSYRTDSSEPNAEFSEDIYAFPNPVEPDYDGVITIAGLVYDTDVKIADAAGHVVAEGKSNGGTFAWDGRNGYGQRVASGIYFVMASNPEGKKGIVTKITIIR